MKSGKEVKLTSFNNNFKIRSGAVENYKGPRSVYVNITSWITVNRDKELKKLELLKKDYLLQIKSYLRNSSVMQEFFDLDTIIQIDISPTRIKMDKPTFFTLEINLYQKSKKIMLPLVGPKNSKKEDLKPLLEIIANDILKLDFIVNNENFNYQLTKKEEKELYCNEK